VTLRAPPAERRRAPRDDLVSVLAEASSMASGSRTRRSSRSCVCCFRREGTTYRSSSNLLSRAAHRSAQLEVVRRDRALIRRAGRRGAALGAAAGRNRAQSDPGHRGGRVAVPAGAVIASVSAPPTVSCAWEDRTGSTCSGARQHWRRVRPTPASACTRPHGDRVHARRRVEPPAGSPSRPGRRDLHITGLAFRAPLRLPVSSGPRSPGRRRPATATSATAGSITRRVRQWPAGSARAPRVRSPECEARETTPGQAARGTRMPPRSGRSSSYTRSSLDGCSQRRQSNPLCAFLETCDLTAQQRLEFVSKRRSSACGRPICGRRAADL